MNRTITREDVLRRVISDLDDRRDGILPMHLAGVSEHFDATSLIGALQLRWHATLSGQIERELDDNPIDQGDAVVLAWARARETHPGLRAALDHAAAHPAGAQMAANLRTAIVKEHAMLAATAGLAGLANPQGAVIGAELERRARAVRVTAPAPAPIPAQARPGSFTSMHGLVERVRHLVA